MCSILVVTFILRTYREEIPELVNFLSLTVAIPILFDGFREGCMVATTAGEMVQRYCVDKGSWEVEI